MSRPESTCWTLIEGAVRGSQADRDDLARRYATLIRSALLSRWASHPLGKDVSDACQEVYLELFRQGGALEKVRIDGQSSFRGYLFGVICNVARRFEKRRGRLRESPLESDEESPALCTDEDALARQFDRHWAESLLGQAMDLYSGRARALGPPAEQRLEILRLRFSDGLPVRDIAARLGAEPDRVHREYARARQDFRAALEEVVAFHTPGSRPEIERQCLELIQLLG